MPEYLRRLSWTDVATLSGSLLAITAASVDVIMSAGIRAEIKVDADGTCPIAEAASDAGTSTVTISKSVAPESGAVTEEFMLDTDRSGAEPGQAFDGSAVFTYGSKTVYRFTRERDRGCPCEVVEQFDCPVVDVHTRAGSLYLVFHAAGMDQLQQIVTTLREQFSSVDIQRLLRSETDADDSNLVFVDRSRLTDRQREVLESAHEMGYFDSSRGANAGEVADELGVATSTFSEHLAAAQRKVLDAVLDS
jgi:hypothetical protein